MSITPVFIFNGDACVSVCSCLPKGQYCRLRLVAHFDITSDYQIYLHMVLKILLLASVLDLSSSALVTFSLVDAL